MTVYFHGNFGLHRPSMAGILRRAIENPGMKDAQLAQPFGYGAPFAAKYRTWLHKTGIAELGLPLRLTALGEIVWEKDPELQSLTTQWFMHWGLTQDPTRAQVWHFFSHKFLPQHAVFTREDLIEGLTEELRAHSEEHFGPGSKLNVVIARKLIECYTEKDALGELGILWKNDGRFARGDDARSRGPWDAPTDLARAYQ
ncbi:MAG: DUF4007 family protein [Ardenticatenaceae bacterium]|nr:DUF4007 family protein [Ardenticatenaceae bacterium]